jgi:hypothetical protein
VAVTVTGYVPAAVEDDVEIVAVDEAPEFSVAGENET